MSAWHRSIPVGLSLCAAGLLNLLALPAGAGVAVSGATLHTLTDAGTIEQGVILIDEGRIQAVGSNLPVPAGYSVVEAGGRVVTPGLIESFSQLSLVEIAGEEATVDALVAEYPSGASFHVRHALNPDSVLLAVNRRDGVTRAVVAPWAGNDPFAGWGVAIRLAGDPLLVRDDLALFAAVGSGAAAFVGGSRSAVIQRMTRGLQLASDYRPNRYHPGPGDFSHQDLATLQRFRSGRAPLVVAVDRAVDIREVVALAGQFDRSLIIRGGTEAWKVAELLARWQVPVIVEVLANLPNSFERLGARLDNAALLHEAGVPVLLTGGETQNARRLRQMAGNAVAHGMPWDAALAAITRVPGELWRFPDGTGTLAKGAPADLVIWSGDPLELTSWAEQVMIDGEWQDMTSRQTRLFDRYRDISAEYHYYRPRP
jgi:imidazolonepropionase-like amidohydrolase